MKTPADDCLRAVSERCRRAGRSGASATGRWDEFRYLGLLLDRGIVVARRRAPILEKRHAIETGFRLILVAITVTVTVAVAVAVAIVILPTIVLARAAALAMFALAIVR